MKKDNLAIATMTYDKKGDPELMLKSMELLSQLPYKVYISDGGSSKDFTDSLKDMGHNVSSANGLNYQLQDSISKASDNAESVLYTEPDKYNWFKTGLKKTIEQYYDGNKGFSAVGRTRSQNATFPSFQQKYEQEMNKIISWYTGVDGDFIYGPKIFPSSLGKQVKEINFDMGWGILMFLVGRADKMNLPLNILNTAVSCPLNQRSEDNELYRLKQYNDNMRGFLKGINIFEDYKKNNQP